LDKYRQSHDYRDSNFLAVTADRILLLLQAIVVVAVIVDGGNLERKRSYSRRHLLLALRGWCCRGGRRKQRSSRRWLWPIVGGWCLILFEHFLECFFERFRDALAGLSTALETLFLAVTVMMCVLVEVLYQIEEQLSSDENYRIVRVLGRDFVFLFLQIVEQQNRSLISLTHRPTE
jgi:hypothetical protein